MTVKSVDIVADLAFGDSGKGKVSSALSKRKSADGSSHYNMVARWAGGNNAGHTVFLDGEKYQTHLVPSGVFHGIPSLIGPGCVLHPKSFYEEIDYLSQNGFDTSLIKVHPNCHIVTDEHISFDKENLAAKLGTTSKGIAPAYSAKYARTGILADGALDSSLIWTGRLSGNILCEGAQGFYLDINHGLYPYVTSSETLPYAACSLGFAPQKINEIWGCSKVYDTRSGEDPRFPSSLLDDIELSELGELGKEYGVTTGRRRKVNWMNLDNLIYAAEVTGTTHLVMNKCDIMEEFGTFKLFHNDSIVEFSNLAQMRGFIEDKIEDRVTNIKEVLFSYSPEII
jgi:adenylosuccinate synthase